MDERSQWMVACFIVWAMAILATFDIFLLYQYGRDYTMTGVIQVVSNRYPIIPFIFGVFVGHLFWSR